MKKLPPELEAKIPHPPAVCIACLHANTRALRQPQGPLMTYCSHSFTGAICDLRLARPLWIAYAPLSREQWDRIAPASAAASLALMGQPQ